MRIALSRRFLAAAALAVALAAFAAPAHALRVATWNMMGYENPGEGPGLPSPYINVRQPNFRTVMAALDPDVIILQEINSATARDSFLLNVLGVIQPGQWTGTWLSLGTGEGGAIFWKTGAVTVTNIAAVATGGPRNALLGVVRPLGYTANGAWFRIYSMHLKAGSTVTDSITRRTECTNLRNAINNTVTTVVGPNFIVGGDSNFQGAFEGGYKRLTESQTNNAGRSFDPLVLPATWHANASMASYDTQCPCLTCTLTGQSGGGMDDRFDLMLISSGFGNGSGLELVPGGYTTFGNDGFHFNNDINGGGFNVAVPMDVANALHDAADHIPVMLTVRLPARGTSESQLAFGDAIVGGTASAPLHVTNVAVTPAEPLAYTLAASAGFGAPAGSLVANAGAGANAHDITMDTSVPGALAGTLTLAGNDNDTTSKVVLLSGRVLAHAVPSLDSLVQVTAGTLDFGDRAGGAFADSAVRVSNLGYGPLQARLAVDGGAIAGDPRFSLVGGFTPTLLAGVGQTWNVHFDDAGAALDSTYTATLTFTSADETLPGATALTPLTVDLRARVLSAVDAVGGPSYSLRFVAPHPNPLHAGTELAFELPRPARVALGVYDLGGRRVATLADGVVGEGRHTLRWNAQDDAGRPVAAGLYFVRFTTPGLSRVARVAVLP